MKLYIYELGSQEHLATLTGDSFDDCETQAIAMFGIDSEYGWTETPNFGKLNGLKFNLDAVKLNVGIGE